MKQVEYDRLISEVERLIGVHTSECGEDEVGMNLTYLRDFINTITYENGEDEPVYGTEVVEATAQIKGEIVKLNAAVFIVDNMKVGDKVTAIIRKEK